MTSRPKFQINVVISSYRVDNVFKREVIFAKNVLRKLANLFNLFVFQLCQSEVASLIGPSSCGEGEMSARVEIRNARVRR